MKQEIIDRIKSLEVNGIVTPEAVVADAANPESPLHSCFEWNDETAADRYRLDQARTLIRSLKHIVTTENYGTGKVVYIRNPDADIHEQGYVSTAVLRDDKAKARRALIVELQRAEYALSRAYDIASALGLDNEVNQLLQQVRGVKSAA